MLESARRSSILVLLVFLAPVASGCATLTEPRASYLSLRTPSRLAEAGVEGLIGRSDSVETYLDLDYLAREVYLPIYENPERRRGLALARCAWQFRVRGEKAPKDLGAAVDTRRCDGRVTPEIIYSDPAAKLAFGQMILEDHPRGDEYLQRLFFHVVDTIGSDTHFRHLDIEDESFLASDAPDLWTIAWRRLQDGSRRRVVQVALPVTRPSPLELRSLGELAATAHLLRTAPKHWSRYEEARSELVRTTALGLWKQSEALWHPERTGKLGTERTRLDRAVRLLERIPVESHVHELAQGRIARATARRKRILHSPVRAAPVVATGSSEAKRKAKSKRRRRSRRRSAPGV